jgi:hypothetical protein
MTRTRLLVLLASALFVAACASSGQRGLSSDDTASTQATSPATTATTFAVDPDPGATTDPELTTASTIPGGGLDCGTFDMASGWPTTIAPAQSLNECLDGAFRAGTPARLVLSAQTDGEGGSPVTTTYLVTGQGIVHVTIDATRAADRPQVVSTKDCRTLDPTGPEPTVSNCENMDN